MDLKAYDALWPPPGLDQINSWPRPKAPNKPPKPRHRGADLVIPQSAEIYKLRQEQQAERMRRHADRLELEQARIARRIRKRQDREAVLGAMKGGAETLGQFKAETDLPNSRLRAALRKLIVLEKITKLSKRRYGLVE